MWCLAKTAAASIPHPLMAQSAWLAYGAVDGGTRFIDPQSGIEIDDFTLERRPILSLAFSPDTARLAVGDGIHAAGIENIMYSWPVATMKEHDPMSGAPRSFLADASLLENGERQFQRKCSICHTLTVGSARRAGPTLHNLFGRRAGAVADYAYSPTLTNADIVWSAETIDALFDEGPDHYIPGTKMPMQRIARAQDRNDLIAFLRTATAPEGD